MAPRTEGSASLQIWYEKADGHREASASAPKCLGRARNYTDTATDNLWACCSLYPRPSLRPPLGLSFTSAGLSGLCGSALGLLALGAHWGVAVCLPLGLELSSASSVPFITRPAARSPVAGAEWTPDSIIGMNQQAKCSREGRQAHRYVTPVLRAVTSSTGNRPWGTHQQHECSLSVSLLPFYR